MVDISKGERIRRHRQRKGRPTRPGWLELDFMALSLEEARRPGHKCRNTNRRCTAHDSLHCAHCCLAEDAS